MAYQQWASRVELDRLSAVGQATDEPEPEFDAKSAWTGLGTFFLVGGALGFGGLSLLFLI